MAAYEVVSKSDNGGVTFRLDEIELLFQIDYSNILAEIKNSPKIDIVTYNTFNFTNNLFTNMKLDKIIINKISELDLAQIKNNCPEADVFLRDNVHAKIILAAPNFVYLGSQNFGESNWFEAGVIIREKKIYDFYLDVLNKLADDKLKINNYNQNSSPTVPLDEVGKDSTVYIPTVTSKKISNVEVKISQMLNWKTKLTGLKNRDVTIVTYTLPNETYVEEMIKGLFSRKNRVKIYAHKKCETKLIKLKQKFATLDYELKDNIHAKMVLVEGNIVWLSSQNFGSSNWFENTIKIKSESAYSFFKDQVNKL